MTLRCVGTSVNAIFKGNQYYTISRFLGA